MKQNEEKHLMSIQFFSLPKYSTKVYAFEQCVYVSFLLNSALGEFAMIYVTTFCSPQ